MLLKNVARKLSIDPTVNDPLKKNLLGKKSVQYTHWTATYALDTKE